jgi:hypothetical protein
LPYGVKHIILGGSASGPGTNCVLVPTCFGQSAFVPGRGLLDHVQDVPRAGADLGPLINGGYGIYMFESGGDFPPLFGRSGPGSGDDAGGGTPQRRDGRMIKMYGLETGGDEETVGKHGSAHVP